MRGRSRCLVPVFMLVILLVGPLAAASGPLTQTVGIAAHGPYTVAENAPAPMAGPRAYTLTRMTGNAPAIDGIFNVGSEWTEAQTVDAGTGTYTVKGYIMADGVWVYVLIDEVSNTAVNLNDKPPPGTAKELIGMVWDGDNNGKISYVSGSAGSSGISYGGKNADFGIIIWGDGTIWNSSVASQGNSIIFNVGSGGNSMVATGFGTTPNSATPHRILEYKLPYDGPKDELGCSIGYPFTKGFNIQSTDNISNVATVIGQWPTNFQNFGSSFDSVVLPQKYPHIVAVKSPKDGDTYQTGQNINFEITSTDNNPSTLTRTMYLEATPYSMTSDLLTKNNLPSGEYNVSFKIQDDEGLSETVKAGKIMISEAEVAPVIELSTPAQSSNSIDEGKNISFSVKWHDDNLDQKNESVLVTWLVDSKAAIDHKFAFNKTSFYSNLTFNADYNSQGHHTIEFSLEDSYFGGMPPVSRSWTVDVNNVNRPPRIFNTEPETSSRVYITEAQPVTFTIEKTDLDNTPTQTQQLTVTWYLNGTEQTSAKNTNTYTFNENPPNYNLAGTYLVKVVVSDGVASDSVQWNITVTDVDRPPVFGPLDPEESEITIKEGATQRFTFEATDPDNNALRYNWSINSVQKATGYGNTGTFDFNTTYLPADGWDSSKCSPCFISVNVTDGKLSIETEWKLIVTNVNRPPVVIIDRPKEGDSYLVGQEVNFKTSQSYDPDKDPLTYSWDFGDRKTETRTDINHIYVTAGKYPVTLTAMDGHTSVTKTVNITIVIPKLKLVDVTYEPNPAKEGEVINISVEIKNTGDATARNVKVKFYLGAISGNPMSEKVVDNITAGGTVKATTTWVADTPGRNTLWAIIEDSDAYKFDGNSNKNVIVDVLAKPKPVVNNPLLSPLVIIPLILIIVLVIIVVAVLMKRKKEADAKEEAAVKAIMDAKSKPQVYQPKEAEASPFDRTDFKFGAGSTESRPCLDCRKATTNQSGLCDDCVEARRAREHKRKMMNCPVCGNEVSKDMFTCPYCHFNFSKADKGELEAAEKKHEAVGYVSDDACADCGVMFNDGMSVLKCPSCEARYHKRCAERLANCAECNAELGSGQTMVFKAPRAPDDVELAETVPLKVPEEVEAAPKLRPRGPTCPNCGAHVEEGWKVCPSCDSDLGPKAEVPPKPPVVEKPKEAPPIVEKIMEKAPVAIPGKCPKCGDDVESDWKVCPSCDTPLGVKAPPPKPVAPPKPEVKPKVEPKIEPVPVAVPGKCPKCGDDIESDWKVCPSCDAVLAQPKPPKPEVKKEEPKKDEDAGKKKIVWSKTAKDKVLTKEPAKPEDKPKVEAKPEVKAPQKPAEDTLKEELEALAKEIEGLEKQGKDLKKAKSLATLASSFLKGKQPDKAKIYMERSRAEMKKV